MDLSSPVVMGLIIAVVIALIFFVLFLVALGIRKKLSDKQKKSMNNKNKTLKKSHEEALEKERIQNKKTITKQQEDYNHMVSTKDREIDALKLFSKNHSEYVTDMRLIGIRERLVKEKRIDQKICTLWQISFYQRMALIILNELVI